jgi:anti-sigma factor RsiW
MDIRSKSCERAAKFVSLEVDGELSSFEQAILRRHLQRCEVCAVYACEIRDLTALLRAAPVEHLRFRIDVGPRRRWGFRVVERAAATAAVAATGLWLGLSSTGSTRERVHVPTLDARGAAGAVVDDRLDWAAGLPRTVHVIRLLPGGLYTGGS